MRSLTAKDRAWRVTQGAYTKRVTGMRVAIPLPIYEGNFDCLMVANAAPLPDDKRSPGPYTQENPTPLYRSHKRAFDELRRLFEDEWAMHEHALSAPEFSS